MVDDDYSQLLSTLGESMANSTFPLNSTEQNTLTESSIALDSTANESNMANSTAITNNDETVDESTGLASLTDISNVNNDTGNCDALDSTLDPTINSTQETLNLNETVNDDTQLNSTCANEASTIDSQADPDATQGMNDTQETTIQNDSAIESAESMGDSKNIFRIKDEYLQLNDVFRLPLSVLQQEINIKLNVFGIPFGRLRRHVKFALPKDFDSLRMTNKRVRDIDECSTTTARKFVKFNDDAATPSIELTASSEQAISSICDSSIVPDSDANTTENPFEASSQQIDGTSLENGATAECSAVENTPEGDNGLSITQNNLENPSQLVDSAIEDFGISDCLTNDDGQSLAKYPRIDSQCDALSVFDSGIGTGTEGSLIEGTITNRRMTLDLTPPSEEIENEMSAEADEQSANRIQEMTNLSEKVHSWHQRLKPILLHSERRNDFDVKETSRNIVECFSNGDQSLQSKSHTDHRMVSFENIMENRDKADTARYFFSMLQMANNRNIQIIVNHNDSTKLCPQDKIMLKLLNPNIREIDPNIEKN